MKKLFISLFIFSFSFFFITSHAEAKGLFLSKKSNFLSVNNIVKKKHDFEKQKKLDFQLLTTLVMFGNNEDSIIYYLEKGANPNMVKLFDRVNITEKVAELLIKKGLSMPYNIQFYSNIKDAQCPPAHKKIHELYKQYEKKNKSKQISKGDNVCGYPATDEIIELYKLLKIDNRQPCPFCYPSYASLLGISMPCSKDDLMTVIKKMEKKKSIFYYIYKAHAELPLILSGMNGMNKKEQISALSEPIKKINPKDPLVLALDLITTNTDELNPIFPKDLEKYITTKNIDPLVLNLLFAAYSTNVFMLNNYPVEKTRLKYIDYVQNVMDAYYEVYVIKTKQPYKKIKVKGAFGPR